MWLNGNCPSNMRTHSTVSLSPLYAGACPSLLRALPRNVDLQGAVLTLLLHPFRGLHALNKKECQLCAVKAQPVPPIICVCVPWPCGGSLGCRSVQTVPPRIGSELELRSLSPRSRATSWDMGGMWRVSMPAVTTHWCQHLPQGRNVETVNAPSK